MAVPEPELVATPDGTTIAVRRISGEGRTIAALHGFTGDGSTMFELIDRARGARPALLIDLVGHGASDVPENLVAYSMSSVVDQVLFIVGALGHDNCHLVGYSMGGRVALSMVARAPWFFSSVTSISSTAGLEDASARAQREVQDRALADRIEELGMGRFLDEWLALPIFESLRRGLDADHLARSREQRATGSTKGLAHSLRGTGTGSMTPVWNALPGVRSPLLAVAGALDPPYVTTALRMADSARSGAALVIPRAGHALHLENPERVATHLAHFLEGCEDPRT